MLNLILQITELERFFILVELRVGDAIWHKTGSSETDGTYFSVLLWYYQYTRAEAHIKIGCFFIILAIIVVIWWFFSYSFEPETYQLFGMSYPNEALEWWYDNIAEGIAMLCYFLYVSFFDLYYNWKPHRFDFIFGTHRVNISRYFRAERHWNPLKWSLTWSYYHSAAGFPLEAGRLHHWLHREVTAALSTRITWSKLTKRQVKRLFKWKKTYFKKDRRANRLMLRDKYKNTLSKSKINAFVKLRKKFRRLHKRPRRFFRVWRRNSKLSRLLFPIHPQTLMHKQRYMKRGSMKERWYINRLLKRFYRKEWDRRHKPIIIRKSYWKHKFRRIAHSRPFSTRFGWVEQKLWHYHREVMKKGRGGNFPRLSKQYAPARRQLYINRKPQAFLFNRYYGRYFGNKLTFSANINATDRRRVNRGKNYTLHHIYVRGFDPKHSRFRCMHNVRHRPHKYRAKHIGTDYTYRSGWSNLTDLQVQMHHWIQEGRRRSYIWLIQRSLNFKWARHQWSDEDEQVIWRHKTRPKWHRRYFAYYYLTGDPDLISRGSQFAHSEIRHWSIGPVYIYVALYNGYCWEEDEIEMYEEEFEDWDLEYKEEDMAILRVTDATREREYDRDLASFAPAESEAIKDLHAAEERQMWRDKAREEDHTTEILDEEVDEDLDITDPDVEISYTMDYYELTFEYYTDPHVNSNTNFQLGFEFGIDMPPAWGFLQMASVITRDAIENVENMIHSFYHFNAVFEDDAVSSTVQWWDLKSKSWLFDGTPLDELVFYNPRIKEIYLFYFLDYVKRKRLNEPDVYQKMLAMEKEDRSCRPNYQGMALWRGYDVLKEDFGLYVERMLNSLPEEEREDILAFTRYLTMRERRGELIPEDDASIIREYHEFLDMIYEPIDEEEKSDTPEKSEKDNT